MKKSFFVCVWLHYLTIAWWHPTLRFHLPPAADADNNPLSLFHRKGIHISPAKKKRVKLWNHLLEPDLHVSEDFTAERHIVDGLLNKKKQDVRVIPWRSTNLKFPVVPGNDCGVAELAVHIKSTHLALQSVPQLLPCFKVPDEVGASMVKLKSLPEQKDEKY